MPRRVRAAAQAAAKSMKNVPTLPDASDEELADAPVSQPSSPASHDPDSPAENELSEPEVEPEAEADMAEREPEPEADGNGDAAAEGGSAETPGKAKEDASASTPAAEDTSQLEVADTPSFSGGRQSAIPRKRRIGRPPKYPRPELDAPDGTDSSLRVSTPVKRRRGRPAASGGRWARNRGPSHHTQVPVDKEGKMMDVIGDEVSLPPNPSGDAKVDENGRLQDGREYRVRTFTILNRGDRLYMLSTEPARCIGFRDSYLFFQKHKMLYKIIIDDDEKRDLIERDLIPHSYKGRAIGVVTARSVFREFGAKIVVSGKKITDDYDEEAARAEGDVEGELAVPDDKLPPPGEPYNRNQYVAWHGASSVYHTNVPSVPLPGGKIADPKKRSVPITDENWMLEHARAASAFNHKLLEMRLATMGGVYDVHTNQMHYPQITQPTHCRWERVPPPPEVHATAQLMTDNMSSLNLGNETSAETTTENPSAEQPSTDSPDAAPKESEERSTIFPPVPASISSRYFVQDIVYESPPYSNMGIPGPDGDMRAMGRPNGVVSLANPTHPEFMTPEIIALLPPDCKKALDEAIAAEIEWKSRWGTEAEDGARSTPLKSYAWYP